MNQQTKQIIQAVAKGLGELAALYGDVIGRMAEAELRALWNLIQKDGREAAEALLLRKMTNEQLVAHKKLIADQAVRMASDQVKADQAAGQVGWVIIKAIVGALVGAGVGGLVA